MVVEMRSQCSMWRSPVPAVSVELLDCWSGIIIWKQVSGGGTRNTENRFFPTCYGGMVELPSDDGRAENVVFTYR